MRSDGLSSGDASVCLQDVSAESFKRMNVDIGEMHQNVVSWDLHSTRKGALQIIISQSTSTGKTAAIQVTSTMYACDKF